MLEWAQSLPFYRSMPVNDRMSLLRKFAVYQLILEYGYATAKSGRNDVWLFSNGSCMPRFVDGIPVEAWVSQELVSSPYGIHSLLNTLSSFLAISICFTSHV